MWRRLVKEGQTFLRQGVWHPSSELRRSASKHACKKRKALHLGPVQEPISPPERLLFTFGPEQVDRWRVFSDKEYGGKTEARLAVDEEGAVAFSGSLSQDIEADPAGGERRLQKSGFASIRSKEDGTYIDLEDYERLVVRLRSDGRPYVLNLHTDNWIVGADSKDVWQAFLTGRRGVWEDVEVPLGAFLLTHRGRVVQERVQLNPHRVISLGLGLVGGAAQQRPGPFALGLRWVKAAR